MRYPPPQRGYLSDTSAIPYENEANGCDTPLCDTISKGYCAIWGGISHWAAKSPCDPQTPKRKMTSIKSFRARSARNVALKAPKISLNKRDILAIYGLHFLLIWKFLVPNWRFFASEGGSCHRGLYNRSNPCSSLLFFWPLFCPPPHLPFGKQFLRFCLV